MKNNYKKKTTKNKTKENKLNKRKKKGIEHSGKGLAGKKAVGQQWYSFGGFVPGMKYIDPLLEQSDPRSPPRHLRSKRRADSDLLYIYTRYPLLLSSLSLSLLINNVYYNSF